MSASGNKMSADERNMLRNFLSAYGTFSLRHHLIVSTIVVLMIGLLKVSIYYSSESGIWWQALNTLNLFVGITVLMYGAIIFSQILASLCSTIAQMLSASDGASATGSVVGVVGSAVLMYFLAPYLLNIIWRI
ncbi:hypothetical protein SAMN02745127_01730 [Oceanospirillum multiglobuliferum]|nr:hypothetical protein SAMN02745127_01730 [Oceanospirillum multiglobuliferum]